MNGRLYDWSLLLFRWILSRNFVFISIEESLQTFLIHLWKLIVFKWIKQSSSGNLRLTLIFKDQVHSQILYIKMQLPNMKLLILQNFKWSSIKSTDLEPGSTKANKNQLFPARKMRQLQKRIQKPLNRRKREEVLKLHQQNTLSNRLLREFKLIRLLGFIQSLENRI